MQAADASGAKRHSWSSYVEADADVTDTIQMSMALRYEDYTDFGDTATGKISGRWDVTPAFAVRGAISTGFRAPSLQQTTFTGDVDELHPRRADGYSDGARNVPRSPPRWAPKPLQPELATNYSLGIVFRADNFTATVDAYQIDINDRIVLSDNITGAATGTPTQVAIYNLVHSVLIDGDRRALLHQWRRHDDQRARRCRLVQNPDRHFRSVHRHRDGQTSMQRT